MNQYAWVDLGDYGIFRKRLLFFWPRFSTNHWQDHGLGLMRTLMHQHGFLSDVLSVKNYRDADDIVQHLLPYNVLLMNVRSYNFHQARDIATRFKHLRPNGKVIVGGMHTIVSLEEMESVEAFDRICVGAGEASIPELLADLDSGPRVIQGKSMASMDDWPAIDRSLWPRPLNTRLPFPLEPAMRGWNPGPVASVMSSRVCPWRCSFCNEASYIKNIQRKSVDKLIDELNQLDRDHGPIGSVVIHDSMFFQQPSWLEEFVDKYPTHANRPWPYWAAARADTIRKWPDLFRRMVMSSHWNIVSIGLESGSDSTLLTLNKECTAADNVFAIRLINEIGDAQEKAGLQPVRLFSNIMWGVPGETREDTFDTIRMVSMIKRPLLSNSLYAPYPGGALGYQIAAEGNSLLSSEGLNRDPASAKTRNIDYRFVKAAMRGRHNAEALRDFGNWLGRIEAQGPLEPLKQFGSAQNLFVFNMRGGRKKVSWGTTREHAVAVLRIRLSERELEEIDLSSAERFSQNRLPEIARQL